MVKRQNRLTRETLPIVVALSAAAFAAPATSLAARPQQALTAAVCSAISGQWVPNTCTIPAGASGVASTGIKIGNGATLKVQGSLTINAGATVTNSGTIVVENAGGLVPGYPHEWPTGILLLGTLDNSGVVTVKNTYDATNLRGTEGITISATITAAEPGGPSPYVVVPGTLANSGTLSIQNGAQTRGIENVGALVNYASGALTIANSGTSSVGIYNRRVSAGTGFVINGTLANEGNMTIASSGDSNGGLQFGYGIYNVGLLTNASTGVFAIEPSPAADDAGGLYTAGTFTNFGAFANNRGSMEFPTGPTWGSFNNSGTMVNYGTTTATGTFYNNLIMVNIGKVTSYGFLYDESPGLTMINYGTFYNYSIIVGGTNKGICIDEIEANPSAGGC